MTKRIASRHLHPPVYPCSFEKPGYFLVFPGPCSVKMLPDDQIALPFDRSSSASGICATYSSYMAYYNGARTHLSLNNDAPVPRAVQAIKRIIPTPILGGLHHQYGRI
jgi:hypothetical protein